jgi:Secretion system C-terminal sorting domain
MGHTHKYGTAYTAHKRVNGQQGELLYDASCSEGIPGCVSPFFDYQHIPMRYFEPMLPLNMAGNNGLIHTASWLNDGPVPVNFGPTSDDEMMVMVVMYTEEEVDFPTDNNELTKAPTLNIYPNPMYETTLLELPDEDARFSFRLFDMLGKEVRQLNDLSGKELLLERGALGNGMYLYVLTTESGTQYTGKLMVE